MNYEFISRYSDYKLSVASLYHTIMRKSLACLYLNIFFAIASVYLPILNNQK